MTGAYGVSDEATSTEAIREALDLGITFLDTADEYGLGRNEELVGRAIRGCRDRVVLATKFGNVRAPDGSFKGISGRPQYVVQACEASLRRLNVDTIDLLYQHRVDPVTPIEETVAAMSGLVMKGVVRYLGLSEAGPATLRRAHRIHPIAALQTEYSLWSRDPEGKLLATCRELGIGFVAYSPLGRGFLTGTLLRARDLDPDDSRRHLPRFQSDNFDRNLSLVARLQALAQEKSCTAAQLALAWLLAQGDSIVPIPGTKRVAHLRENVGALRLVLTKHDLAQIDALAPLGAAAGERYSAQGMSRLNL